MFVSIPQLKPWGSPSVGEKAACVAVSHTSAHCPTYRCRATCHYSSCTPTSGTSAMEIVMSWILRANRASLVESQGSFLPGTLDRFWNLMCPSAVHHRNIFWWRASVKRVVLSVNMKDTQIVEIRVQAMGNFRKTCLFCACDKTCFSVIIHKKN